MELLAAIRKLEPLNLSDGALQMMVFFEVFKNVGGGVFGCTKYAG